MTEPGVATIPTGRPVERAIPGFRRILIATDGTSAATSVIAAGVGLAQSLRVPVIVIHSIRAWHGGRLVRSVMRAAEVTADPHLMARAETCLEHARIAALAAGVRFETRLSFDTNAPRAILDMARDAECDLIAIGADTARGWHRGNVARRVVEASHVAVLVIPWQAPTR